MAQHSEGGGLRRPERPKPGSPSARGAESEPGSPRGPAYTPPPAEGPRGTVGSSRPARWLLGVLLGVALLGAVVFRSHLGLGSVMAPSAPVQIPPRTLGVGAADIDPVATSLAKQMIAEGKLPPPPPGPATVTPSGAAARGSAAPVLAPPKPASVVHQPRPAPGNPAPATPATAPAAETEQAVRQVLEQAPAEVRQSIADGKTVIYSLHVLDDVAEDGDVVEVFVNGASQGVVNLTSVGQDLLVPLPSGSTARVHVVALQDGGGGVTFGVASSMGEIRSTVMPVGGSDDWSVTIQ